VLETYTVSYENGGRTGSAAGRRLRIGWQGDYRYGDDDRALSVAAEYTREGFHQRGIATAFGDPRQNQTMDTTSVVAEWRAPLGPVAVSTSVRHDRASDFRDATTYRLAARLPLGDGTALFATVGTGARNPTFTDRYGFTPDTFIGNPDLDVERSISYSFAIERAFGASLTAGVALFRDRLEDEIESFVFDADLGGFTARNSNGRSHRDGIEPWLRWQATDALAVEADYAFVDATEPDATGRSEEVRRARHSGALRVHWIPVPRFALTAGAAHVGERRDFDFATFPARRVRLGEHTLLHCAARWWANERIEIGFRAENATDADYEDVLGYRSPGRSLTFTVSGRF
jgi:vitamin B12 transporter